MEKTIKCDEILDNAGIAIFATDKAGFITYSNQAARALLGLDETRIAARITEIVPALGKSVMQCLQTGNNRADLRFLHGEVDLCADISLVGRARAPRGAVCCLRASAPKPEANWNPLRH